MSARAHLALRLLSILLFSALSCSGARSGEAAGAATNAPAVVIATASSRRARVEVEVARTDVEREHGLMFRERLGADRGMLFVFPETGDHVFWMKDTLIPLDMIFIDGTGAITGIVERAEPRTLTPRVAGPSRYVLEVNGGWCERNGVRPGDRVRFENWTP